MNDKRRRQKKGVKNRKTDLSIGGERKEGSGEKKCMEEGFMNPLDHEVSQRRQGGRRMTIKGDF